MSSYKLKTKLLQKMLVEHNIDLTLEQTDTVIDTFVDMLIKDTVNETVDMFGLEVPKQVHSLRRSKLSDRLNVYAKFCPATEGGVKK